MNPSNCAVLAMLSTFAPFVPCRELQHVLLAGGTRGIGRAIVREHLLRGDNVFIASRNEKAVREALSELQVQFNTCMYCLNSGSVCCVDQGSQVTDLRDYIHCLILCFF
jgi:NAD(P)-dependent dehydrogenase (short-subunit alcohol dehydrogenase family)